ncbi:SDR family oxidoreductase [Acrocarpospora catenulata]|uniref:SDR family oxidoreductase n=1 Tax=Acrocarpospora catenulata TaxID=2836182 RepID=UPI001BD9D820|nr:SDR family oxidoreductase [Acrocarpospora catenulata]
MKQSILVTGGTGVLGRHVVDRLSFGTQEVRVLSRTTGTYQGDLVKGTGLDAAVAGVDTILHLASDPRKRGADLAAARNLLAAAEPGAHLVYISIVGVDRHPFRYYQEKFEVERLIENSGRPYTILRATQFHELVRQLAQLLSKSPVVPVPNGWKVQSVASEEVAERLAELAMGPPAGRVPDMGGPEVLPVREAISIYLRATGQHRVLFPVWVPGRAADAFRRGLHLAPEHATGRITFSEFVAANVKAGHAPTPH